MPLTTAHATRALVRANLRAVLNTLRGQLQGNRLMFGTIAVFLSVYVTVAHTLVHRGLVFVHEIALLGPLLTERLIYLLFFFFFGMLILSNATITGMGLFRRKETSWLLSLPLQHHSLVIWKTLEGMALASWGLILLSAPILAAIGRVMNAGTMYYIATLPAVIFLVLLAANLSTCLLLVIVRYLRPAVMKPVGLILLLALVWAAVELWPGQGSSRNPDMAANVANILRSTDYFTHPLLPSSWVAEGVLGAARGAYDELGFYTLCLLSYALATTLLTLRMAEKLFYPAWICALQPSERSQRLPADAAPSSWLRWLGLSRLTQSLILKDLRTFVREPAQWGQTVLIFGLLFLYMTNLRRIVFDYKDGFWAAVTSHLNLLVACLSLSTLTTRFIFPQLSQEGQRIWILGMSPVPMARVMHTKLALNCTLTGILTTGLILLSCIMLETSGQRATLHLIMIIVMTLGLNTMAMGIGGLFPNFQEPNPAKIVSSFGGTLCLILSFIYILLANVIGMLPSLAALKLKLPTWLSLVATAPLSYTLGSLFILTLVFGVLPYFFAVRRMKSVALLIKV
jgi:ABC-2 type transport system permease protein